MSKEKMNKINVIAPLNSEAASLASVANALSLPPEDERQPDLHYLTAIFVSSGMNKNGAVFLGSELAKARNTIGNKAVDMEHNEQLVVGHITGSTFLKRDRTPIDIENAAATMSAEDLDELEMDIGITATIHKSRFPEISEEVLQGEWMVSMEAFYRDFDVKVGDMIIPREKAEEMGFDKLVGSVVQLRDGSKEMGFHLVGRVLRDIIFAGVGLVKNPANPRSIIMESADIDSFVEQEAKKGPQAVININDINSASKDNPSTHQEDLYSLIEKTVNESVNKALNTKEETENKEQAKDFLNHTLPGTCVHYRRFTYNRPEYPVEEEEPANDLTQYPLTHQPGPATGYPGVEVEREHYCNLFDLDCTARPGDATLPDCWINVFARSTKEEVDSHEEVLRRRRVQEGLVTLQEMIDEAKKFIR